MENSVNDANRFFFSLDTGEIRTMNSKSDNVEIMMGNETDDIIKKLFESFKKKISRRIRNKNGREPFYF